MGEQLQVSTKIEEVIVRMVMPDPFCANAPRRFTEEMLN